MNLTNFLIQLVIAAICAGLANMLIPRKIPGKLPGLLLIGLAGVWVGSWGYGLLREQYGLQLAALDWQFQGVPILPSVIGSAIVLYLVTWLLKVGRYT